MEHQEFNVVSKDGTYLTGRLWKPEVYPRAVMCLVHGIGEHSGRYHDWVHKFCDRGLLVYGIDLRGHGLSEGQQGHIGHLSEYLDDINSVVRRCKRTWRNLPQFLYGHSMGGALVLSFLMRRRQDFAGAIITSPWLQLVNPPAPFLKSLVRLMDSVWPAFSFSAGIKSSQLTGSSHEQSLHQKDAMKHDRITIRLFNELDKAAHNMMMMPAEFYLPLFFAHGTEDTLTSFEATRGYAARVGRLARFYAVQDACHEVHREPGADKLFAEMLAWMESIMERHHGAQ